MRKKIELVDIIATDFDVPLNHAAFIKAGEYSQFITEHMTKPKTFRFVVYVYEVIKRS